MANQAIAYDLLPGMVKVEILNTESPIDIVDSSPLGTGHAYGMTGGHSCFGSPVFTRYTIQNPGKNTANVSLRISTVALNPFAYLGISGSP